MSKSDAQVQMFVLLRQYANSQDVLKYEDIQKVTGWTESTFIGTYYSKMYREFMEKCPGGYKVYSHFARISPEEFLSHVTQSRRFFGKYNKVAYSRTIIYEFLLPLTKEDKLRRSLDELFYKDTLEQRYSEIEVKTLERVIPRNQGETESSYREKVLRLISDYIGGYSISHVNGRYRAGELSTQQAAVAAQEIQGARYIQDETTASVRFIIPCPSSRKRIDYLSSATEDAEAWEQDLKVVRTLFFEFFVEAIIKTIRGEDEIWLLETSNVPRLFVFEKA